MLDFNTHLNKSEVSIDPQDINDLLFNPALVSLSKYNEI